MRSFIALLSFLLTITQSRATDLYDQLRAFNPYWGQYAERLNGLPAQVIDDDVDYVRAHLAEVLGVLNAAKTSHLTADQLTSRTELIAVLADYAQQGRFPINYYRHVRIPVFIDEHDTHCAVGYLMQYTGCEAMARRIATTNNYAWVREITDPELGAWQIASGFSLDELKLIQGAYDFYERDAFLLPDKYEVPQKPEQVVRYFEGKDAATALVIGSNVWCYGEGANGDLHGRWEQNYSATLPWIIGYFEHGKRSGRWKEYYKGTDKLCRTENWRDDKLNGIRTRYDREGQVIETILFKNGQAVTKTNIDHEKALRYVRSPIDSATVYTEVFTIEGALIAAGNERIYNPEGLSWFQNIELTALNTYAISARDGAPRPEDGVMVSRFARGLHRFEQQIPGSHTLVQYKKEGEWVYYKDYLRPPVSKNATPSGIGTPSGAEVFELGYRHFGTELWMNIARYDHLKLTATYDSMRVVYADDRMVDFFGYTPTEQDHLQLTYHPPLLQLVAYRGSIRFEDQPSITPIKQIARLDPQGNLIGVRVDYDPMGEVTREDRFYVPFKKEEEMLGMVR
ncbi:MAG: hypothetical protein IPP83_07060 [Flavobacteriales bacterium]|nr:hypothetical protein [Flavobacteriales bacterium]